MIQSIKNIIAAIIISISVYLIWTTILPKYHHTTAFKKAIEQSSSVLLKRQEIFKMITDLAEAYQQRYSEFQRLALVIPDTKSLPELISTIENTAFESGIVIVELKIDDSTKMANVFNVINFEVNADASYDAILNFIGLLEKNIRLIDVSAVSMSIAASDISGNLLTTQIKAKTYFLNPLIETTEGNRTRSDGEF